MNEGKALDIGTLTKQQCEHYLHLWDTQKLGEVQFTDGDVAKLRSRVGGLGGQSILQAILTSNFKVAIELCLQFPSYEALMEYSEVKYIQDVFRKASPIGCGQTAVALSKLFLGTEGAKMFGEIHAVSLAKNEKELGLGSLVSEHEGKHDPQARGVITGSTGDLPSLVGMLQEQVAPIYIQFQIASNPRALGHAYVIEVFARERQDQPIVGMLHQSYIGKYYLFDWIEQQKGATIDVLAHLVRLKGMCESFNPKTYAEEYLTKDEQNGFLTDPPSEETKLGVAFSAMPLDFGTSLGNVEGLLETRGTDIKKTTTAIDEEREKQKDTMKQEKEDEPVVVKVPTTRIASVMDLWMHWEGFKMGDKSAQAIVNEEYVTKIGKLTYKCTEDNGVQGVGAKRFTFTPV